MKEDTISKIGKTFTTVEQRDAVHFAVAPVTLRAGGFGISPGAPIRFAIKGNVEMVEECDMKDAVGIADPFIEGSIVPGESFFMLLKPGTITGLRHEWSHPAFDTDRKAIAEWWLRDFADKHDMDYGVIEHTLRNGSTRFAFGNDINYPDEETCKEFMKHAEILSGFDLGSGDPHFDGPEFRCAC